MRYLKYLIQQVRAETENEEVSDFVGIQDQEFIQYFNDAQARIQSRIIAQHPSVFVEEVIIDIVSGQEAYNLPSDAYLGNKVSNVEYSFTGKEEDFYALEEASLKRRSSGIEGSPSRYIRKSGKLLLAPVPSQGKIKINYIRRVKELDLRRGAVRYPISDLSSGANLIFNSTLFTTDTTGSSNASTEKSSLEKNEYICVVDKDGITKMKNIPLTGFSTSLEGGTSEIVLQLGSHTPEAGESISAGDYVVGGKDTSTHSSLPTELERYLIAYCSWKILKRDSSVDSQEAVQELIQMEQDIIAGYAAISDDIRNIPEINDDGWLI